MLYQGCIRLNGASGGWCFFLLIFFCARTGRQDNGAWGGDIYGSHFGFFHWNCPSRCEYQWKMKPQSDPVYNAVKGAVYICIYTHIYMYMWVRERERKRERERERESVCVCVCVCVYMYIDILRLLQIYGECLENATSPTCNASLSLNLCLPPSPSLSVPPSFCLPA